jgi:hypothetical protein
MENIKKLYLIFPEKISSKPSRGIYEASNIQILNKIETGSDIVRYIVRCLRYEFTIYWDVKNNCCMNESNQRTATVFVSNDFQYVTGTKNVIVAFSKESAFNIYRHKLETDKNLFESQIERINRDMNITLAQLDIINTNGDDLIVTEDNK